MNCTEQPVEREAAFGGGPKTGDYIDKVKCCKHWAGSGAGSRQRGRKAGPGSCGASDCSTPLIGPLLTHSSWSHKASSCQLLSFFAGGLSFSVGDAFAIRGQPEDPKK